MAEPVYQVFALRYGTSGPRERRENFIFADAHEAGVPLDYYVWVIRDEHRTIVVDTGFNAESAGRRGRRMVTEPVVLLKALGVDAAAVSDVVITHLHYDHAGNLGVFAKARFHMQDDEMAYATGRHMAHACLVQPFDVEDVVAAVRHVHAGRVCFHKGSEEIAPGVELHRIGGHTGGLQIVRVRTAGGWLVLASDALHFAENRLSRNPFPLVFHVGEMMEGFRLCERLADGEDRIIPGHDPAVLAKWPRVNGHADIVRVDLDPLHAGWMNEAAKALR
jgi:glyoxylase-like metal-dependent hydrolase (beta-lactamase superfamily II)